MGDYKTISLVLMLIVTGFKGTRAQVDCSGSNPCMNGGTCENDACTCAAGFNGALCSTDIDDCDPNPCLSGGTCTDGVAQFTCACVTSYAGDTCETIDCSGSDPCMNGGTCENDACTCAAGFNGALCSTDIDDCDPNPCLSGGTCTDGVAQFTCACVTSYAGDTCETTTTPATRMLGALQCHSCSTNSITDVCSTADDLASGSGVSTVTCYEEQSCWTDHYENSSHTVVSRGCTDDQCNTHHEGGGPYCTSANGVTSCTSCCSASKCNDKKSSSEGLTSSCVTWLTSLFSLVIMIIAYRT